MKQLEVRADKIVIKGHYSNLVSGVILLSAGSFPLIDFVLPMILDVRPFHPGRNSGSVSCGDFAFLLRRRLVYAVKIL